MNIQSVLFVFYFLSTMMLFMTNLICVSAAEACPQGEKTFGDISHWHNIYWLFEPERCEILITSSKIKMRQVTIDTMLLSLFLEALKNTLKHVRLWSNTSLSIFFVSHWVLKFAPFFEERFYFFYIDIYQTYLFHPFLKATSGRNCNFVRFGSNPRSVTFRQM